MKCRTSYAILLLVILFSCFFACKKDKNNSTGDLKIATVERTNGGSGRLYRIVYDNSSNVDSILWTGVGTSSGTSGFSKFTYIGTSFNITDQYNNTYTVYADGAGKILQVRLADTLIMHYKNNLLEALDHKSKITVPPYYYLTTEYYEWKNNDLIYVGPSGADGTAYYYDGGKGGQAGDAMRVDNFLLYGRSYIKTAHIPKGAVGRTDTIQQYFYLYDSQGRISQLNNVSYSGSGTDTVIYRYSYR